jgi:hypothetical protein
MGGGGCPVTAPLLQGAILGRSFEGERSNKMIRKHFRIRRLVLGLAFGAALVVPVAQATPHVDGPVSGVTSEIQADAYLTTEVSPYELRGTHIVPNGMTVTPTSVVRSENSFGAPGPSAGGAVGPHSVATASATTSFDWNDAGIGAAAAFGVALLLVTAVMLGRRNRTGLARA